MKHSDYSIHDEIRERSFSDVAVFVVLLALVVIVAFGTVYSDKMLDHRIRALEKAAGIDSPPPGKLKSHDDLLAP